MKNKSVKRAFSIIGICMGVALIICGFIAWKFAPDAIISSISSSQFFDYDTFKMVKRTVRNISEPLFLVIGLITMSFGIMAVCGFGIAFFNAKERKKEIITTKQVRSMR